MQNIFDITGNLHEINMFGALLRTIFQVTKEKTLIK